MSTNSSGADHGSAPLVRMEELAGEIWVYADSTHRIANIPVRFINTVADLQYWVEVLARTDGVNVDHLSQFVDFAGDLIQVFSGASDSRD